MVKNLRAEGHQPIMAEPHKRIMLNDELSPNTACAYKRSYIKICSKARYPGTSPQPSAILYTSMKRC